MSLELSENTFSDDKLTCFFLFFYVFRKKVNTQYSLTVSSRMRCCEEFQTEISSSTLFFSRWRQKYKRLLRFIVLRFLTMANSMKSHKTVETMCKNQTQHLLYDCRSEWKRLKFLRRNF